MRRLLSTALALGLSSILSFTAQAQQPADYDKLVTEGLALYADDKNEEALKRFEQALTIRPDEFRALYGKALVLYTTAHYAESAALCQKLVDRGDDKLPNVYVTYGTSLDRQKKSAEAVAVYQQALRKYPTDEPLHRYMGIALQSLDRDEEAARSFQQALRLAPNRPVTNLLLAQAEGAQSHRVPALMAAMHSLLREKQADRAFQTAGIITRLLQVGVKQTGSNTVTLNLGSMMQQANSSEVKPDDFAQVDVLLTMDAALDYDEKYKKKAPAERLAEKLGAFCRSLDAQKPAQRLGFNWEFYAPFFIELEKNGHVPALAYVVASLQPDASPEVKKWMEKHQPELTAMAVWTNAYKWPGQ